MFELGSILLCTIHQWIIASLPCRRTGRSQRRVRGHWTGLSVEPPTPAPSLHYKSGETPTNTMYVCGTVIVHVEKLFKPHYLLSVICKLMVVRISHVFVSMICNVCTCTYFTCACMQLVTREIQALRSLRKIVAMSNGSSSLEAKVKNTKRRNKISNFQF